MGNRACHVSLPLAGQREKRDSICSFPALSLAGIEGVFFRYYKTGYRGVMGELKVESSSVGDVIGFEKDLCKKTRLQLCKRQ